MSDAGSPARSAPRALPAVLAAAVLGISVSGPLARLSDADPLAIATWRVGLSLLLVACCLVGTGSWREYRQLRARDLWFGAGAGAMLALHFWSWIASLGHTSVAASVVLVNLHPVVIVAGSALAFAERPTRPQLAGIAIATVGAAIVALGDAPQGAVAATAAAGATPLFGDLLAVLGALTVGVYYLTGRSLRQRLSIWPYVGLVFGTCLVVLLLLAGLSGARLWPQPPRELWIFCAIAAGPMLLGHVGFNWSLRYVPAYVVSLALLLEPVGATLMAALLPGIQELPGRWTLVGGAIALGGLALGAVAGRRAP